MRPPKDDEPLLDVAGGDPALSRHLRDSLKTLGERTDDPEFRRLVADVLEGRRGLREVATTPAFASAINPRLEQFAQRWAEIPEEERAELADQGEREFTALRQRLERERRDRERWWRDHPDGY
ncbi:hypothetical protein GCM10022225_51440 [Plantactinospora mayteni]|uniref:Uncharacterized protein n=1 Tax=Plantactinospora mayteni TaxID=566021 RepID=A0ABQ4EZ59_9ACTN|nr:hypothetical protein [Plantactinospora mayteni]GIG99939.1 hypothetical protein Pma05_65120 [Plantactinospora mayteni]